MDHKETIITYLEEMRKKEQADKETWKARAYAKVIRALKEKPGPIRSLDDIQDVPGIGEKIHEKIKEIIETGKLHQVNALNESYNAINTLMQVHGIGPSKASELVRTHGILTIEDLEKRQEELLNDTQKKGLKYFHDIQKRIPHAEMTKHDAFITQIIKGIDPAYKVTLAGSYRRQEKDSGDIDVLVCVDENEEKSHDDKLSDILKELSNGTEII